MKTEYEEFDRLEEDGQKKTFLLQNYTVDQISVAENKVKGNDGALHFHDCFEFELITEGRGYQILNGEKYVLTPGSLSLLSPLDYHAVGTEGEEAIRTFTVMIHTALVPERFYDMVLKRTNFLRLDEGSCRQVAALFETIRASLESGGSYGEEYYGHLIACFFAIFEKLTEGTVQENAGNPDFRKLLSYVGLHFRENPSVSEIAEKFHYSPNYVSRLFEKHLHKTFVSYLTEQKTEYAARLLRTTDLPITQICFESGFGSFANFSRVFRQKTGLTPSDYRRKQGKRRKDGK